MRKQGLFKMSVNTQLRTEELWDLTAEILTELSRRDGVDFRINATRDSVEKKVTKLNAPPKRNI